MNTLASRCSITVNSQAANSLNRGMKWVLNPLFQISMTTKHYDRRATAMENDLLRLNPI